MWKLFSHSDGKGNFTRQSGKRHSLSPSIDHLSLDVVDHVPGKVPESSFPVRLYIFEVLRERFNVDSSISFRHVRISEQLADMLTKGAFTTSQWKSLMRLFDIHQPSNLNVDSSFSVLSCSAVIPIQKK